MSVLYFLFALIGAWITYNLYRPAFRHQYLSAISFAFGWIIGETVLHVMVIQLLVTTAFALMGSISGLWGILGLFLFFLSWMGMTLHFLRGFRAKRAVEEALTESLGKDYGKEIASDRHGYLSQKLEVTRLLKPWQNIIMVKSTMSDERLGEQPRLGAPVGCPFGQEAEFARPGLQFYGEDFFWTVAVPLAEFEVTRDAQTHAAKRWKQFLRTGTLQPAQVRAASARNAAAFFDAIR